METTSIALNPSAPPRRGRTYWQTQVGDWQSSGLSKAAFCRREAIKVTTFYYWCGVFTQSHGSRALKRGTEEMAVNASFVPVRLSRESTAVMTVQLGDVTVSCHQLISAEQLGAWLTAIRRSL